MSYLGKPACELRGCSVSWRRIVLDEAQQIRSHDTLGAVACSLLQVRKTYGGNKTALAVWVATFGCVPC